MVRLNLDSLTKEATKLLPPIRQETQQQFRAYFLFLNFCWSTVRFHPGIGKSPWRRKWQPTPVFLPGKSHERRSLASYSPCSCEESDTTERLNNNTADSQCCPSFRWTAKWLNHTYVHCLRFFSYIGYYRVLRFSSKNT